MASEEQPTLYSRAALPWINMTSDVSGQPHDSVMHLEVKHLQNRKLELFMSMERQWSMKKSTHPLDGAQSPHVWCHVDQTLKWVETSFTSSYLAVVLCLPLSPPPPYPAQRRQTCCKLTLMIPNSDPMSPSSVLLLKMRPELPDPFVLLLTLLPNLLQSRCQGTRHFPDCRLTSCLSSQGFSSLISSAGVANFPAWNSKSLIRSSRFSLWEMLKIGIIIIIANIY